MVRPIPAPSSCVYHLEHVGGPVAWEPLNLGLDLLGEDLDPRPLPTPEAKTAGDAKRLALWAPFGDGKGEVGLTDEERRGLESCPNLELVTIRGSGHMALNDNPGIVAGLILEAIESAVPAASYSS